MYSVRYIQILNVNYFILKIMMGIYPHVLGPSAELELLGSLSKSLRLALLRLSWLRRSGESTSL